jgi:hypothetical protein
MDPRRRPTQRPPAFLIGRQRYRFLVLEDEMRAQDGPDAPSDRRLLKLDRAVDPIGIGASEGRESPLCRSIQQRLRARDAAFEREVRVDVQVSEHSRQPLAISDQQP